MRKSKYGVVSAIAATALLPALASAQIVISEITYDAVGSDTDQEYVEIFNAGNSAIDLTKWKVNDGSNHVLNVPPKNGGTGSITLQPGGYALLVDNAANFINLHSGISTSVIDTVLSLPNASGTVSIINESGATEDSVAYTKDMGAAGDGNSLHRTSMVSATLAAGAPTPGTGALAQSGGSSASSNTNTSSSATTAQNDTITTPSSNSDAPVSSTSNFPVEPEIFAYAGKDREVIAGADSIFEARAFDKKKNPIKPGRFLWTFGDGSSGEGQTIMHHFPQPGRYAVVVDIAEGYFSASHQIVVTALPASISLSVRNGDIVLANKSGKNLDLSYWSLRSGGKIFLLPKNTILLGGASVPFVNEVTKLSAGDDVSLLYPNGVVAAGAVTPAPASALPQAMSPDSFSASTAPGVSASPNDMSDPAPASASSTAESASAANAVSGGSSVWWFGAIGLTLAGAGAVAALRRAGRREWNIIEEKP